LVKDDQFVLCLGRPMTTKTLLNIWQYLPDCPNIVEALEEHSIAFSYFVSGETNSCPLLDFKDI
jgi:hypothetical protein